jgi:hypothetical protein
MNGYVQFRPSPAQRAWRFLGFKLAPRHPHLDNEGYIFATVTHIRFSWVDRLRVLLSGHVAVATRTETDVIVSEAKAVSEASVLHPGWR